MNWELIAKVFGGTSLVALIGLLLKHFVVSAPVTFQARRSDAARLIEDLQSRVKVLERQVDEVRQSMARCARERDILFVRHDIAREALLTAAQLHEDGERPGAAMIRQWRATPDSRGVVEAVQHDIEEPASPETGQPTST